MQSYLEFSQAYHDEGPALKQSRVTWFYTKFPGYSRNLEPCRLRERSGVDTTSCLIWSWLQVAGAVLVRNSAGAGGTGTCRLRGRSWSEIQLERAGLEPTGCGSGQEWTQQAVSSGADYRLRGRSWSEIQLEQAGLEPTGCGSGQEWTQTLRERAGLKPAGCGGGPGQKFSWSRRDWNPQVAGAVRSGHKHCGSGRDWNPQVAGAVLVRNSAGAGGTGTHRLRERSGVDTNIAGAGGTETRRLRGRSWSEIQLEQAGLEPTGCGSCQEWTQTLRERAGLKPAGGGGGPGQKFSWSGRDWNSQVAGAVLVTNSAGVCGFKKTVPRRALIHRLISLRLKEM